MIERRQRSLHRWGHGALAIALTLLVGGALMLWAWNTIAIELLGAPAIRFKHVLALQGAIAALTALPLVVMRCLRRD